MKLRIKKFLSIILAVLIVFPAFSFSAFAENEYKNGDIIEYGWYPQTLVADSGIISGLNAAAPEWDEWISYDYTYGTGEDSVDGLDFDVKHGDFMRYVDITVGGEKYRGVKFTDRRPGQVNSPVNHNFVDFYVEAHPEIEIYKKNTVYWFKFEPVKWKILDAESGLALSDIILDSQPFNDYYICKADAPFENYGNEEKTVYACDYEKSSIRKWLTGEDEDSFLNTAFSYNQRKQLKDTVLETVSPYEKYEILNSAAVTDKVFLLSYYDLINEDYGFSSDPWEEDKRRFTTGTDYAKCQGLFYEQDGFYGGEDWLLRTPGQRSDNVYASSFFGDLGDYYFTNSTDSGIRPAITFDLSSNIQQVPVSQTGPECTHVNTEILTGYAATCTKTGLTDGVKCLDCGEMILPQSEIKAKGHKYEKTVTPPTEDEGGYTTYTCSGCGDSYIADETEKLPHKTHKFVYSETVAPTCTEKGYDIYACSVCGLERQSNYTQAKGHDYENGVCVDCGKIQAWNYEFVDGKAVITGIESDETELRIPSTIEGKPVEKIAASALEGNKNIKYVYIPDSVKYIESNAFKGCSSLNEVYIGTGVVSIGSGAFADCTALSLVCTDAGNFDIANDAFSDNNPRLTFISREGTGISEKFSKTGKSCVTYSYPLMRDDKKAIAYHGDVVAYQDLNYHYWNETALRYDDAAYIYFESIEIQGVDTSEVAGKISENHYVKDARNLTLKEIYISVNLDGEDITFDNLAKAIKEGYSDLLITFDDADGGKLTILQRIGRGIMQVLKTLTKLLNSIIKAFKK